jgi:hypothetical protein
MSGSFPNSTGLNHNLQFCSYIAGEGLQNFKPVFGAQGLWRVRDLYRATPAVTRDLGFCGLIRSVASYDTQGDVEDLF